MCSWKSTLQNTTGLNVNFTVLHVKLVDFSSLLFVFKAIHGIASTYLRDLVSIKRPGNFNLRFFSDSLLLAKPTYRSRVTL